MVAWQEFEMAQEHQTLESVPALVSLSTVPPKGPAGSVETDNHRHGGTRRRPCKSRVSTPLAELL